VGAGDGQGGELLFVLRLQGQGNFPLAVAAFARTLKAHGSVIAGLLGREFFVAVVAS
jgi:hypothetical protein